MWLNHRVMHQMCLYPTSYTVKSLLPNGNSELTAQSSRILEVNLRMSLRSKYTICSCYLETLLIQFGSVVNL
jgi:hypothetical protein